MKEKVRQNKQQSNQGQQTETITFAKVASMLESSKDRDTLDLALDMIRLVSDELQRDELVGIGRRVAAAIEAAA